MRLQWLLFASATTALLACNEPFQSDPNHATAHSPSAPAADFGSLDDVPVQGGELRFVVPDATPDHALGFPLTHTNIATKIGGPVAVTEIEQEFANPYDRPLEAVYAFPLGAHGAISGYSLSIGDRTIAGEIQPTARAQETYDNAVAAGQAAAIVKQVHPNLFTQRVANIAPHQRVRVRITYVELLDYDAGHYTLTVPLTIGPRYNPASTSAATAPNIGYISAARAGSTVGFSAEIDAGTPLAPSAISSPTHEIVTRSLTPTRAYVAFADRSEIPNKDIVLRFTPSNPTTTAGISASRTSADGDGFFVLSVVPKQTIRDTDVAGREVMIVIDHSGSMRGEPIAQARRVATGILGTLGPRDTFDVVAFSGAVDTFARTPLPATTQNIQRGLTYLDRMSAAGGTEMGQGVAAMLAYPPADNRVRIIYFMTDGDVGNDDQVVNAARAQVGTNRIFTVGVGASPNRSLLDKLAAAGRGYATYIAPADAADNATADLLARSAAPVLTDITVDWGELAHDVIGQTPAAIPDVYAGKPLVISAAYHEPMSGTVTIRGRGPDGAAVALPLAVELPEQRDFPPAEALFARRQIEMIENDPDANKQRLEALGMQFHVVTQFTSFVAVDRNFRVASGLPPVTVAQPDVLPADVESAPPSHHYSSGGGGSWGGWGSGGPDDSKLPLALVLVLSLGVPAWLVGRRFA